MCAAQHGLRAQTGAGAQFDDAGTPRIGAGCGLVTAGDARLRDLHDGPAPTLLFLPFQRPGRGGCLHEGWRAGSAKPSRDCSRQRVALQAVPGGGTDRRRHGAARVGSRREGVGAVGVGGLCFACWPAWIQCRSEPNVRSGALGCSFTVRYPPDDSVCRCRQRRTSPPDAADCVRPR